MAGAAALRVVSDRANAKLVEIQARSKFLSEELDKAGWFGCVLLSEEVFAEKLPLYEEYCAKIGPEIHWRSLKRLTDLYARKLEEQQ